MNLSPNKEYIIEKNTILGELLEDSKSHALSELGGTWDGEDFLIIASTGDNAKSLRQIINDNVV